MLISSLLAISAIVNNPSFSMIEAYCPNLSAFLVVDQSAGRRRKCPAVGFAFIPLTIFIFAVFDYLIRTTMRAW